jgi:hypothetical protein
VTAVGVTNKHPLVVVVVSGRLDPLKLGPFFRPYSDSTLTLSYPRRLQSNDYYIFQPNFALPSPLDPLAHIARTLQKRFCGTIVCFHPANPPPI